MSAAPPTSTTGRSAAYPVVLLAVFIDMVAFGMIIPLTPYYAQKFGASPDTVTLLMSTFSVCQLAVAWIWGWISDKWGRKPVLVLSLIGSVLAFTWLAFVDSLLMLFLARAFGGLVAGKLAVAQAYIADVTTHAQRPKAMGLMGAAIGMGFILGPAVGGLLAGDDAKNPNYLLPFLSAAGVSLLGVVMAIVLVREPVRHAAAGERVPRLKAIATALGERRVALPIVLLTLVSIALSGLESVAALWTERAFLWGPQENGYFFAFTGIVLALIQGGAVGPASKRFGVVPLCIFGTLIMALGLGALPLAAMPWAFYAGAAVFCLGYGFGHPSLNSYLSIATPAHIQGAVMGASQSAQSFARIVGPAFAGFCFAQFGRDAPFIAGAAVLALAFLLAFLLKRPAVAAPTKAPDAA